MGAHQNFFRSSNDSLILFTKPSLSFSWGFFCLHMSKCQEQARVQNFQILQFEWETNTYNILPITITYKYLLLLPSTIIIFTAVSTTRITFSTLGIRVLRAKLGYTLFHSNFSNRPRRQRRRQRRDFMYEKYRCDYSSDKSRFFTCMGIPYLSILLLARQILWENSRDHNISLTQPILNILSVAGFRKLGLVVSVICKLWPRFQLLWYLDLVPQHRRRNSKVSATHSRQIQSSRSYNSFQTSVQFSGSPSLSFSIRKLQF